MFGSRTSYLVSGLVGLVVLGWLAVSFPAEVVGKIDVACGLVLLGAALKLIADALTMLVKIGALSGVAGFSGVAGLSRVAGVATTSVKKILRAFAIESPMSTSCSAA